MATRARPSPWTTDEVSQVKGLLSSFSNDAETVCAVMDCSKGDLNWLCRQAFGITFQKAVEKYALVGRARIKSALFKAAEDGNSRALDMMAREHLQIMGPVERRRRVKAEQDKIAAEEIEPDF